MAIRLQQAYDIPEGIHGRLLSLLLARNTQWPVISVPVPDDVDLSEQVSANSTRLVKSESVIAQEGGAITDDQDEDMKDDEDPINMVDLQSMVPTTLKDQLSTVVLKSFPNLNASAIEKTLVLLSADDLFVWSSISSDFETRLVFVRYVLTLGAARLAQLDISGVLPKVNVVTDPSLLSRVGEEIKQNVTPFDTLAVSKVVNNKRNVDNSSLKGTEDLDQVLQHYNNYKVDKNELIDVPLYMKDGITRDIIKFRSEVLIIERENRKKEIELERIKAKERLKKVFEGVSQTDDGMDVDMDIDNQDQEELPNLTDAEYDEHLEKKHAAELSARYKDAITQMSVREAEHQRLQKRLAYLKNYETDLIDNKLKHIDDARNLTGPLVSLYTKDHASYLRQRVSKRSTEEAKDKEILASESPIEEAAPELPQASPAPETTEKLSISVDISKLSEDQRTELRTKILQLIEEYLGVEDDVLVQVINDSLEKKGTEGRDELVEELQEILDEDAENLVNDLYEFIAKFA